MAVAAWALAAACAGARPRQAPRLFIDRPVAWHEHDDGDLPRPPAPTDLAKMDRTLILRDSLAAEADYHLSLEGERPALDVNALDEVPCSTWFCPRNHLTPMPPEAVAAGPPDPGPRLPLRIVKGKTEGVTPGFEVIDAAGRRFVLKVDPPGHAGMATGAEAVGARLFHAAGYNVPANAIVDLGPGDLTLDPGATYDLYGVQERPLTEAIVAERLARAARLPDGRLRAVAVGWLPGRVLGAFDMRGTRGDDPNDRIPHERRRSLRASWVLVAWLGLLDTSSINTLDCYVQQDGRRFVRHYFIDFGAGLGSSTTRGKSLHQGQEHLVEVWRTLGAFAALGLYRRPYEGQRSLWVRETAEHPSLGWFPAEAFDPDDFRTYRKLPTHRRMTVRDAYWGAKLVTSFTDAQLAAVAAQARLPRGEELYLAHALRVRRDTIGRRYLAAMTAVEAPRTSAGGTQLCFTDLAAARGHLDPRGLRYHVSVERADGAVTARGVVPAAGAETCLPLGAAPPPQGYRIVQIRAEPAARGTWVHLLGDRVVGIERDE